MYPAARSLSRLEVCLELPAPQDNAVLKRTPPKPPTPSPKNPKTLRWKRSPKLSLLGMVKHRLWALMQHASLGGGGKAI